MDGHGGASSSSNSTRKRKLLEVSQTVLPKGHSLKIVDKEKAPGRLLTSSQFLHSSENPLMSKIKNFLPQLKGANEELEARVNQGEDPNKFNVEYISDDEKQHVEMNIQLVADEDTGANDTPTVTTSSLQIPGKNATSGPNSAVGKPTITLIQEVDNIETPGNCTAVQEKAPLISIIIPVYNGEKDLNQCFQSIIDQTFDLKQCEVSIFDDSSTDSTMEIILKWKKLFKAKGLPLIHNDVNQQGERTNRGAGYAKNAAVKQSCGKYLCFLDSDDTMMPDRLEKQYDYFVRYFEDCDRAVNGMENLLLGSGFVRDPVDATQRYTRWCNSLSDEGLYLHQYRELTIIQPTWFMRRTWFHHVGGFRVNVDSDKGHFPSDLDFFHRHLDLSGKLARIREPLITYRYNNHSLSWKISRRVLLRVKAEAFERRVIFGQWSDKKNFMIWGNGRDGRDFLKALSYEARTKLKGFGDIDPKKIARGYQYERGGTVYPVVYFDQLVPPVVICVAMDRGGQLEKNVESMKWREGEDYYHFC